MKFGSVPEVAKQARPWAKVQVIGPPPGEEYRIGSVESQVDDETMDGRTFRLYIELEDGDLERIQAGNPIEFGVVAQQLVPVSVGVWATAQ